MGTPLVGFVDEEHAFEFLAAEIGGARGVLVGGWTNGGAVTDKTCKQLGTRRKRKRKAKRKRETKRADKVLFAVFSLH